MGYTIDEMKVGQSATFSKTVSEADVYNFAGVSGDFNPAHLNADYCKDTPFGQRIAHGMLSAGFISTVLGTSLPGTGTIYMGQNLKFLKPVFFGDTITAHVEVQEIITEKNRVIMHTYCTNQDGVVVIEGEATVMPPRK